MLTKKNRFANIPIIIDEQGSRTINLQRKAAKKLREIEVLAKKPIATAEELTKIAMKDFWEKQLREPIMVSSANPINYTESSRPRMLDIGKTLEKNMLDIEIEYIELSKRYRSDEIYEILMEKNNLEKYETHYETRILQIHSYIQESHRQLRHLADEEF